MRIRLYALYLFSPTHPPTRATQVLSCPGAVPQRDVSVCGGDGQLWLGRDHPLLPLLVLCVST